LGRETKKRVNTSRKTPNAPFRACPEKEKGDIVTSDNKNVLFRNGSKRVDVGSKGRIKERKNVRGPVGQGREKPISVGLPRSENISAPEKEGGSGDIDSCVGVNDESRIVERSNINGQNCISGGKESFDGEKKRSDYLDAYKRPRYWENRCLDWRNSFLNNPNRDQNQKNKE